MAAAMDAQMTARMNAWSATFLVNQFFGHQKVLGATSPQPLFAKVLLTPLNWSPEGEITIGSETGQLYLVVNGSGNPLGIMDTLKEGNDLAGKDSSDDNYKQADAIDNKLIRYAIFNSINSKLLYMSLAEINLAMDMEVSVMVGTTFSTGNYILMNSDMPELIRLKQLR